MNFPRSAPWRLGSVLFFTILAGCATTADIDGAKGTWNGSTYDEVVSRWGTPVRQTTLSDGSHVYTWVTEAAGGYYPGTYGSVGVGGEIVRCERTLTFREGRVAEQLWQGDPRLCSSLGKV
jgi:hypothetical protein